MLNNTNQALNSLKKEFRWWTLFLLNTRKRVHQRKCCIYKCILTGNNLFVFNFYLRENNFWNLSSRELCIGDIRWVSRNITIVSTSSQTTVYIIRRICFSFNVSKTMIRSSVFFKIYKNKWKTCGFLFPLKEQSLNIIVFMIRCYDVMR